MFEILKRKKGLIRVENRKEILVRGSVGNLLENIEK